MLSKKVILNKDRVKEAKTALKWTYIDFCKLWNYSCETQISDFATGKKPVDVDRAMKLADKVGWRLEYLTGEDDYRTQQDREKGFKIEHNKEFYKALAYLDSLNIHLELCPCICCSIDELRTNNTYEPYLYYPEDNKQLYDRNVEGSIKRVFRLETTALTKIKHINDNYEFSFILDSLIDRVNKDITKNVKINDEALIRETGITLYYEVSKREATRNRHIVIGYVPAVKIGSLIKILDNIYIEAAESIFTSDLIN